jgi:hypothetical protein
MPAEKVYSTVIGLPGQPPTDRSESPHVRVAWGTDGGYVQIGTLFDRAAGADIILNMVNEWLKAAGLDAIPGREELTTLIATNSDPDSLANQFGVGFDGFHPTLDQRGDVNKLIHLLKRARDGAFGRDE